MKKTVKQQAIEAAQKSGVLPHEWLLNVMRGEPIMQKRLVEYTDGQSGITALRVIEEPYYPPPEFRLEAAKAAAPYYAPKLAVKVVENAEKGVGLLEAFRRSNLTGVLNPDD